MSFTILKTVLRDQLRRPWLTGLLILSVALGVAVVIAVDLANESASRAFALSTAAVTGRATHQIVGGPNGLDETIYQTLRTQLGYRMSAPIVEGYALSRESGRTMHVLGVDVFAEPPFRTYFAVDSNISIDAYADLLTKSGTVVIGADSAGRMGLRIGDATPLIVGTRTFTVTIVGLLNTPNDVSSRALDGLILTDISTAQELFDLRGKLSHIDLIATPSQVSELAKLMPTGVEVQSASADSNTLSQLTAAFNLNLTAFSLLAVGVGMFLIYNTTMFSIVQRRRVLGILRSVGVTGDQVFRLILFESASAGAIGALVGIGLGVLLARLTVTLVTQTINDLYFTVSVQSVDIQPVSLIKGLVIGMLASLVSSVMPAAEASGVNVVSVLKRSDLEERVLRSSPRLFIAGIFAVAAGSILILLVNNVDVSFAGLFIGLVGVALCVPWLTTALMRATAMSLGRHSLVTRMAARTITKALSRTSVAIATLVVAVSVTIGVSVMISSFRATVEDWLGQTLRADLYISPPAVGANRSANLGSSIVETIRNMKGVEHTELLRTVAVDSAEFGEVNLSAVSANTQSSRRTFRFAQGNSTAVWDQVSDGAVLVTEPFASRHSLRVGDGKGVTLLTKSGLHAFPIAGVLYDYSSDQGYVLMSLDKYRELWDDQNISGVSVYLSQGANSESVQDEIQRALSGTNVVIQSNTALRETALAIFDRTFAITLALRLIAIVVAFIGVLSALMVLQIERTREFGTLRAVGMTLTQLWQLTLTESGLMGAVAGALAIPVGLAIALVLIYVINFRSFGWTIFFQPVPETYFQAFLVSTGAALIASVYPMIHLSKMEPAEALREE